MESGGFCLGMFPSVEFMVQKINLDQGDAVFLFTDGLTECRDAANEELTEEGLIKIIKKNRKLKSQNLLDKIYEELESFTTGTEQMDDMTLVIVKRTS